MADCSPLLSSCAWMVSTTRLKRLLGPGRKKSQLAQAHHNIAPQRQRVVLQQQLCVGGAI